MVRLEEGFGKAGGLAPKYQVILRGELRLGINPGTARFDEPETRARLDLRFEGFPVRPAMPSDVLPIVHARALELGVVEFEAERLDEMQDRVRGRAETGDVAGVGRNLWFEKNNIHVQ